MATKATTPSPAQSLQTTRIPTQLSAVAVLDQVLDRPASDPFTPPTQVRVTVHATDPISRLGLISMLNTQEGIQPVPDGEPWAPHASIVAAARFDADLAKLFRHTAHDDGVPRVLAINEITDDSLYEAAECGVAVVIPRRQVNGALLAGAVRAVLFENQPLPAGAVPLRRRQIQRSRETASIRQDKPSDVSERETTVLRLVADGRRTAQIADTLRYSESTIKNILYDVMARLNVSNRTHAVAYAIRHGLI
jgi:DNA-binding NarL/FixJ family response regulator